MLLLVCHCITLFLWQTFSDRNLALTLDLLQYQICSLSRGANINLCQNPALELWKRCTIEYLLNKLLLFLIDTTVVLLIEASNNHPIIYIYTSLRWWRQFFETLLIFHICQKMKIMQFSHFFVDDWWLNCTCLWYTTLFYTKVWIMYLR